MRAMRLELGIVALTLFLASCDGKQDVEPATAKATTTAPPTAAAPSPAPSDAGSARPGQPALAEPPASPSKDPPPPAITTAPAVPPPPATPPATAAAPTEPPEEFDASAEKFGELKLGLSVERVQELFPGLKAKGGRRADLVDDGVLVGYDQKWVDKASGVTLTMTSETKAGSQILSAMVIEAPSTLKSSSGVGVGDTVAAVQKAYPETADSDLGPGELFALNGWLTLTIKDGKVASMTFAEPYMGE